MCNILFSDALLECKLYEALKFIMLYQVTEVYEQMKTKKVIPSLFRLLFTRETSSDPLSFMMNHLNSVGDTCGLEQVNGAEESCVWWGTMLAILQHVGDCSLLSAVIKPAAKSGMHAESLQSRLTLCDPMDCGSRGSSVHGLLQARRLERVAIASCRESSWTRDRTWVFCIGRRFFTTEPPGNPAKRWWVGITALQSERVIQAFLPYASCCVFTARWPASRAPVWPSRCLSGGSRLSHYRGYLAGSPAANWDNIWESMWLLSAGKQTLLKLWKSRQCFSMPIAKGLCFTLLS